MNFGKLGLSRDEKEELLDYVWKIVRKDEDFGRGLQFRLLGDDVIAVGSVVRPEAKFDLDEFAKLVLFIEHLEPILIAKIFEQLQEGESHTAAIGRALKELFRKRYAQGFQRINQEIGEAQSRRLKRQGARRYSI